VKFQNTFIILICLLFLAGFVTAEETAASEDGMVSSDRCSSMYNLQEANRLQIPGPSIVDIDEETGNILVRGPLPLIVRDGSGNTGGCRDQSKWEFAYDGINEMLKHDKDFVPDYLKGTSKGSKLTAQLQNFDLKDYKVIDISLLNTDGNINLFEAENRSFGGKPARCSMNIPEGSLNGQPAGLIQSPVASCAPGQDACILQQMKQDTATSCSYANLISEMSTLMKTKGEKKLLIYYHCHHGMDRTGGVSIGYLSTVFPSISVEDAITFDKYLGEDQFDPARVRDKDGWHSNDDMTALARMYCNVTTNYNPKCWAPEPARINLPGRETHSHLPGQDVAPVVTQVPAPASTLAPAPVQTPVPRERYNPTKSSTVNF
jgi:hypothetical protein